jgi:hypothetical protein
MAWIFGYGSLLAGGVLPPGAVPCTLRGRRRHWGVAMDNRADLPGYKHYLAPDGSRPAIFVAFLDLRPQPGSVVDGLAIPVPDAALPALDDRERNYDRVELAGGDLDAALDGPVFTYRGSAAGRARLAQGLAAGSARISRAYAEAIDAGHAALGGDRSFAETTDPEPCPRAELRIVRHAQHASPV